MRALRNDQVFTPKSIVCKMLDMVEYSEGKIENKKIFEPSFGAGAFLFEIANRILAEGKNKKYSEKDYIKAFDNVYGIEKDAALFCDTKQKLTDLLITHGIKYDWRNLVCADSTTYKFDEKFDVCIGNPPFARIHQLNGDERSLIENCYKFGQGNTDLYIIFFEIGLNSIKPDGKLCYITPNSYLRNTSQSDFRAYLSKNKIVKSIIDFRSYKVFNQISTYAAISLFDLSKQNDKAEYVAMIDCENISFKNHVDLTAFNGTPWVIQSVADEKFLNKVSHKKNKLGDICDIQYGLATNADDVYIINKNDVNKFEKELLVPVIKASKLLSDSFIIFPYTKNKDGKYVLIEESVLRTKYPKIYNYLLSNKILLLNRDLEENAVWYQFGRSQGIQSVDKNKIVLKHIISETDEKCSILEIPDNTLVYSGLFVTIKDIKNYNTVKTVLKSKDFCRYLKLNGKNMSGGYKSVNAKIIKNYRF